MVVAYESSFVVDLTNEEVVVLSKVGADVGYSGVPFAGFHSGLQPSLWLIYEP